MFKQEVSYFKHLPLYEKKIQKRSMKNFTKIAWNQCLASKDWSFTESKMDLNQMAEKLSSTLDEALDEIAPMNITNLICCCVKLLLQFFVL